MHVCEMDRFVVARQQSVALVIMVNAVISEKSVLLTEVYVSNGSSCVCWCESVWVRSTHDWCSKICNRAFRGRTPWYPSVNMGTQIICM